MFMLWDKEETLQLQRFLHVMLKLSTPTQNTELCFQEKLTKSELKRGRGSEKAENNSDCSNIMIVVLLCYFSLPKTNLQTRN